jgi:phosphoglycolate phosphatase-like HAD superfamily hydrolase
MGPEAKIEHDLESILDAYLSFLRDEIQTSTTYRVLPGITEILESLSIRPDVLLGLATGNIEVGARIKLQRGNLNRFFSFGVATGRYTSDELRDAGAAIVVSDFRQDSDHFLRSTFMA